MKFPPWNETRHARAFNVVARLAGLWFLAGGLGFLAWAVYFAVHPEAADQVDSGGLPIAAVVERRSEVTGSQTIQIKSAVPTFIVPDVARTAQWYAEHLGFSIAGTFPGQEPYAYASVQRDAAEIMLLSLPGYEKPDLSARRPEGHWDAYLRMDGVHALYEAVRDQPFVHMPLKHQPYGDWEFEVRDPNGYVLVFGGS